MSVGPERNSLECLQQRDALLRDAFDWKTFEGQALTLQSWTYRKEP